MSDGQYWWGHSARVPLILLFSEPCMATNTWHTWGYLQRTLMYNTICQHLRRWIPYWDWGMNKDRAGRTHIQCTISRGGGREKGEGGMEGERKRVERRLVVSLRFRLANLLATTAYKQGHSSHQCCDCVSSMKFLYQAVIFWYTIVQHGSQTILSSLLY